LITSSGRFDLEEFCKTVQEHRPERSHLVPPIMLGLGKHPMIDKYDMSSLRCIISAAAPLGIDTENAVKERFPGIQVKQGWGMSELSPLGLLNSDFNAKPGSVGPLVSNTYAKVVGEDGKSLPAGENGELLIKGPQVMMGYLDDPDKSAECLSHSGWLRTGDIAHYDEEGYFFITDRIKELIKVRGFQVAPAELEALLLNHEAIMDVAVIQVPDEASGEVPRAYVVLKDPEGGVTQEDIKEWVKERVAPYKRLEGGVIFTNVIPKSASGKILRRILRDQVKEEFAKA
jgi:4-coumarate--CoA ligase